METINGSLMQVCVNELASHTYHHTNVSVNFNTFPFNNNKLTFSRNVDKICPEYIILELENQEISTETLLETLHKYLCKMFITFKIGNVHFLKIPFSLLWNLNKPEIVDYKLYLMLPFELFFGNVNVSNMQFQEVTFELDNYHILSNYVIRYGLLCKTYVGNNTYRRRLIENTDNTIQQISSIEIQVNRDNLEEKSNLFRVRTGYFKGLSKGFFIERENIDRLNELKFFINGEIRTNYNKHLIKNKCIKISDNMIYYPFNNDALYTQRSVNSFIGGINLNSCRTFLALTFDDESSGIKVYSPNLNLFKQEHNVGMLEYNINVVHLQHDFRIHTLLSTEEELIGLTRVNYEDVHHLYNTLNENRNPIGIAGRNTTPSGMSGHYYRLNHSANNRDVIMGPFETPMTYSRRDTSSNSAYEQEIIVYQVVPENKKTCNISLEEIQPNERYMTCSGCLNNYNEVLLKRWINRMHQQKTCPTCRSNWNNDTIYINAEQHLLI
jgi:hypothetical protein